VQYFALPYTWNSYFLSQTCSGLSP